MRFASRSRGPHRTVSDIWPRLAGEFALIADLASQGAAAARHRDARALAATTDHRAWPSSARSAFTTKTANTWTRR
jgi:hypothetical protein